MTYCAHLGPDLVVPTCLKEDFDEGILPIRFQSFKEEMRLFCPLVFPTYHMGLMVAVEKVMNELSPLLYLPLHNTEIDLLNLPFPHGEIEAGKGFTCPGK